MVKYSYIIVLIFTLFACQQNKKKHNSNLKATKPNRDTIKVETYSPPFPNTRLFLEYINSYYGVNKDRPELANYGEFKTLKINILYNTQQNVNPNYYRIDSVNKRSYFKTLYTTNKADSLMLDDSRVETVKQNGEYYILFFPRVYWWSDFTPDEKKNGDFLFTPVAFHLDTNKFEVTKLRPIYKSGYKDTTPPFDGSTIFYIGHKQTIELQRDYFFSKKKKYFIYSKREVMTDYKDEE